MSASGCYRRLTATTLGAPSFAFFAKAGTITVERSPNLKKVCRFPPSREENQKKAQG
jgi:hypothetical protein